MKVLFAVSNEGVSESIIKKYQQEYKEIISSKNVYYFNAIAKELQKDKTYDRIVISEDLEPFANNNYEVIDKFIFEKLDNISDEATSANGQDIPIILICADRRTKSEALLVKLFGIGIYSALLGQDRSVTKVCELINQPRTKKDAKVYYRVDSDDVDYKTEAEGDVSEIEIQNILNHYKRLGKNEDKYIESFDNIAAQYTDAQLRVICKFLPLNVKAVLESGSQKYQELITFGTVTPSNKGKAKTQEQRKEFNSEYTKNTSNKQSVNQNNMGKLDILEKNIGKSNLKKPVVIPSTVNIANVKKIGQTEQTVNATSPTSVVQRNEVQTQQNAFEDIEKELDSIPNNISNAQANTPVVEEKKGRGRPKKVQPQTQQEAVRNNEMTESNSEEAPKKRRGRPKKVQPQTQQEETSSMLPGFDDSTNNNDSTVNLFELGNEEETVANQEPTGGIILPGFDEEEITTNEPELPGIQEETVIEQPNTQTVNNNYQSFNNARQIENVNQNYNQNIDLDNLITRDKKVISFVGTSKNGTSFLVNNVADALSKRGIKTAILDLTKNKNAYYIYTQNEENLRKKAFSCITNLKNGIADGIQVNKDLTVYTTLPGEDQNIEDYESILKTLVQNYSLVLMDCDFDTNYGYFKNAQEIYLIQSFDILTIQPLTAFLRNLKTKNILDPEKLRVVLNKVLRVRSITERTIIGGMAFYNDPAMSFMTELFNKDTIRYCAIPFEEQTYSKYLEGLVNCQISTNGYSKNFMMSLDKLLNMVYPLVSNNDKNKQKLNAYTPNGFSNNMNSTLNKMKTNY